MPDASSMTSSNRSYVSGEGCSSATSIVPCRREHAGRGAGAAAVGAATGATRPATQPSLPPPARTHLHWRPARAPLLLPQGVLCPGQAAARRATHVHDVADVAQALGDLVGGVGVEAGGDLVGVQHARVARQRLAARHALLLAAEAWGLGGRARSSCSPHASGSACLLAMWPEHGTSHGRAAALPLLAAAVCANQRKPAHAWTSRSPARDAAHHLVAHHRVGAAPQAQHVQHQLHSQTVPPAKGLRGRRQRTRASALGGARRCAKKGRKGRGGWEGGGRWRASAGAGTTLVSRAAPGRARQGPACP